MTRLEEDYRHHDRHHYRHTQQQPSAACPSASPSVCPGREQGPCWSASWSVALSGTFGRGHVRTLLLLSILLVALQPALASLSEEDGGSGDGGQGGDFSLEKYVIQPPFQFVEEPRDQQVIANHVASFTCRTTDTQELSIEWRKNGRPLNRPQNRYMVIDVPGGSVLRIDAVHKKRHNATFECVVENAVGDTISSKARLTVYEDHTNAIPKGFPEFQFEPKTATVEVNRSKVWNCTATGNPKPEVKWYKDFKPLDITNQRYSILPSGSLQISESTDEDEGGYECVAENEKGTAFSQLVTLHVKA